MGEEYREEIIALLDKIKDAGALAYLHTFIKLFAVTSCFTKFLPPFYILMIT